MSATPLSIVTLISVTFGFHIALVNLDIALATIIVLMKWIGDSRRDDFMKARARTLMRYYASTYAVAGVFGTAFTVVLLSFYPSFLGLAGNIAWAPFSIAILMIVLRFLSIAGYWYLWDRVSSLAHMIVGAAMAVSGFLIPFGFRAVFAFLNAPYGLELSPKPHLDLIKALSNPTFAPLYIKSVLGAMAVGSMVLVAAYSWRYLTTLENEDRYLDLIKNLSESGLVFLVLSILAGGWYSMSLFTASPYKFYNVFGSMMGVKPEHDLSGMFYVKMMVVAAQLLLLLYIFMEVRKSRLSERKARYALALAPLALAGVVCSELLNMYSQLPYFVARPDLVKKLPELMAQALMTTNVNSLANLPSLFLITTALLVPLIAAVLLLFYLILSNGS